MKFKRGIGLLHYNRFDKINEIVESIRNTAPLDAKIIIADDGSDFVEWKESLELDDKRILDIGAKINLEDVLKYDILMIRGPNLGVSANKNRILWGLQDCNFIALIEDDLKPIKSGWFEAYENAAILSGIHHFCRVQDREVPETVESFSAFMGANGFTPIYGPHPRGDLTFITSQVIKTVGGFNPLFRGAGYAHGEYSKRVAKAGLINHPNKWIDIKEARDKFIQVGDTTGGRWNESQKKIKRQLKRNAQVLRELEKKNYIYHPLTLE